MSGAGLVQVHLHGPLAEQFGAVHSFAIRTPAEAIQALDANFPGFLPAFTKYEHYAIYADGDWLSDEHVYFPVSKEVHFCPFIEGRAFLGGALIGALFPALAGTATASIIGGVLMAGLFLGISMLLTPKAPKTKDSGKDENYAFSGAENVTAQGAAVPLIYGRVYAGTVVVSAGLELDTEYVGTLE